ncbi:GTPase-associated system all-helical protein GASH [Burkholderia gladioli]|uniref:GTPase-associated system all-helical protein GASH n=1 Tax=Burkholderia gladioli TaxID=28095 RepID=UPI001640C172|nr:GTPase-associated system all-helical protein GASH [Burkholderia gladioli]MDN7742285.1 GTPase-associated system all-helical protein GASH [Burkholderia gladioli]
MHQEFPKLFAEISTDGAERDQRWAGIKAFVGTWSAPKVEVLVRLAFGTKAPAGGQRQEELAQGLVEFHKAFSDIDPSFESGGRQDQVLAAAALLQFWTTDSRAAMALTTTACGGARKADLPIDLVTSAENALTRLSATRRKRPDLSNLKVEPPEFEFEPDFAGVQPNQPQTFKGLFENLQGALNDTLYDLTEKFNRSLETLVSANKMADEELDMLSWVFGGRSLVPSKAFTDVPPLQKPLVFARDLASLTKIRPGPKVVPALLSRAGINTNGVVKVVDAVNAMSDEWTTSVLKGRAPSAASSPIHAALARREETGADGGWQTGWAATTGIDVGTALSPIVLAELFYREILWLS